MVIGILDIGMDMFRGFIPQAGGEIQVKFEKENYAELVFIFFNF